MRLVRRSSVGVPMQLLLLGLTGTEPAFAAWNAWLRSAGVLFDAVSLNEVTGPLRVVDDADAPCYQGLILAAESAIEIALEPAQRSALERLERHLGLRRLLAYAVPGPEHGLRSAHWAGLMDDLDAVLTPRGRDVFPYLRDRLPVDPGSWAYLASVGSADRFEVLVTGPEESALLGIHHHDGREEMVQMFSANSAQSQGQALRRGQLAWLTRGCYVGCDRHYLSVEVDDVLMANHSWNVETHETDRRPGSTIRMRPGDATRAADWARARGLRLDLACNGAGSSGASATPGSDQDPLLAALLSHRDTFGWINHTYRHLDLDAASQAEVEAEISANITWATGVGIDLEPGVLVTGAHTGLANLTAVPPQPENPRMAAALHAQGIKYVACDASRPYPAPGGGAALPPGTPFAVGSALAVPRHPTLLPHDAATPSQVLDRLRSEGAGSVTTFAQAIDREARRMFTTVISNDPRPHYFHQSNLIGAEGIESEGAAPGIMFVLLDAVLDRYHAYIADGVRTLQPTLGEAGDLLQRRHAWQEVLAAGLVRAHVDRLHVVIENRSQAPVEVPLTGAVVGDEAGSPGSGWICAMPGETAIRRRLAPVGPPSASAAAG